MASLSEAAEAAGRHGRDGQSLGQVLADASRTSRALMVQAWPGGSRGSVGGAVCTLRAGTAAGLMALEKGGFCVARGFAFTWTGWGTRCVGRDAWAGLNAALPANTSSTLAEGKAEQIFFPI